MPNLYQFKAFKMITLSILIISVLIHHAFDNLSWPSNSGHIIALEQYKK
jgi:hypothetical protein